MRYYAVIPAAGSGTRMGGELPKQYLPLLNKPVLQWSVDVFLADEQCHGIVVALAASDQHFARLPVAAHPKVHTCVGGASRRDSVRNALQACPAAATALDWVWVHDAARPGIDRALLNRLKAALTDPQIDGAIAAVAATDTMKAVTSDGRIQRTVDRSSLIRAQTPQAFRLGALRDALDRYPDVTDEASAMEQAGARIRWVEGAWRNLKLTTADEWLALTAALREKDAS